MDSARALEFCVALEDWVGLGLILIGFELELALDACLDEPLEGNEVKEESSTPAICSS